MQNIMSMIQNKAKGENKNKPWLMQLCQKQRNFCTGLILNGREGRRKLLRHIISVNVKSHDVKNIC